MDQLLSKGYSAMHRRCATAQQALYRAVKRSPAQKQVEQWRAQNPLAWRLKIAELAEVKQRLAEQRVQYGSTRWQGGPSPREGRQALDAIVEELAKYSKLSRKKQYLLLTRQGFCNW